MLGGGCSYNYESLVDRFVPTFWGPRFPPLLHSMTTGQLCCGFCDPVDPQGLNSRCKGYTAREASTLTKTLQSLHDAETKESS